MVKKIVDIQGYKPMEQAYQDPWIDYLMELLKLRVLEDHVNVYIYICHIDE